MVLRDIPFGHGESVGRARVWPLFLVPIAAAVYYASMRTSFAVSLARALWYRYRWSELFYDPSWDDHWIYRSITELVSVLFGVSVAAGLVWQRAVIGGMIGGLTIAVWYLLKSVDVVGLHYFDGTGKHEILDLYQRPIESAIIILAPIAGVFIGKAIRHLARSRSTGFIGMNFWHLTWLWIAAFAYARGMIGTILASQVQTRIVGDIGFTVLDGSVLRTAVLSFPILFYALPVRIGLKVLTHNSRWSTTTENIVGPLIIVVGWVIATVGVFSWITWVSPIWVVSPMPQL
jgi:hypothetical protein